MEQYNQTVSYFEDRQVLLEKQVDSLSTLSDSLHFDIARKEGVNAALLTVQDKLQDRLDELQEQMDDLGSAATNKQESLSQEIEYREAAIALKEKEIEVLKQIIETHNHAMDGLYQTLVNTLEDDIEEKAVQLDNFGYKLTISIRDNKLFSSTRPIKLAKEGGDLLKKISGVFEQHPDKFMTIIGHSDNTKPNTRYYKDNWSFSALKATELARVMIEEFYVGSNQVTSAAKSEFEPKASNSTEEGRITNQRVELVITVSDRALMRKLEAQMGQIDLN